MKKQILLNPEKIIKIVILDEAQNKEWEWKDAVRKRFKLFWFIPTWMRTYSIEGWRYCNHFFSKTDKDVLKYDFAYKIVTINPTLSDAGSKKVYSWPTVIIQTTIKNEKLRYKFNTYAEALYWVKKNFDGKNLIYLHE